MTVNPALHGCILLFSVALLWFGAEWVVMAASRIARRFKLPDLIIGATIVALGTSSPEICVTLLAAFEGQPDISVGNVVGSNIFNAGLILGSCAVIWTIPTSRPIVFRDTPVLLFSSALLLVFLLDHTLGRAEGLLMMALLGGYIAYMIHRGRDEIHSLDDLTCGVATPFDYIRLATGLAAILAGAHFLVDSASVLARMWGIEEWAIGITIVAGGTSLPELATALIAGKQGRTEMMAGMLIGSDIFNLLGVLGLAAFIHPLGINPTATRGVFMMVGMVGILLLFMRSGWRLSRTEGCLLIGLAFARWSRDLAPGIWN